MTLGELKRWAEENNVDDSFELYVNDEDSVRPSSLDDPYASSLTMGIATKNPRSVAVVVFN